MAITVIVMGAVFGLLARGFGSTPVEMERADLQAQARHALEQISRDVLQAGTGLPPEFPAFTPATVNAELESSGAGGDVIEMVGYFDQGASGGAPVRVLTFDGREAITEVAPGNLREGDLVLIYDDEPTEGTWLFGLISSVRGGPDPALTVKSSPGDTEGDVTLPPFIDKYNRPSSNGFSFDEGFVTPVSIVSYEVAPDEPSDSSSSGGVLWRRVNWGEPTQVAYVEDLQIRYFIGGTVDAEAVAPIDPPFIVADGDPPPVLEIAPGLSLNDTLLPGGGSLGSKKNTPPKPAKKLFQEQELQTPPFPQLDPHQPVQPHMLVRGVHISVTSRSKQVNLEGSTLREGQSEGEGGYLRVTLASRVAARNLIFRLGARGKLEGYN